MQRISGTRDNRGVTLVVDALAAATAAAVALAGASRAFVQRRGSLRAEMQRLALKCMERRDGTVFMRREVRLERSKAGSKTNRTRSSCSARTMV